MEPGRPRAGGAEASWGWAGCLFGVRRIGALSEREGRRGATL